MPLFQLEDEYRIVRKQIAKRRVMEETEKESSLDIFRTAEDAQRSLVLGALWRKYSSQNGAEIFRGGDDNRMCRHYGVESESAFILSNGILLRPEMKRYMRRCVIFLCRGAQLDR